MNEFSASFEKPEAGKEEGDDEELFLSRTSKREPCCIKGSHGADFSDRIKPLIQRKDLQVVKSHYSAFAGTSLLMTLRSKLITDVYICGCMTNLSVYATAMDAARYGIEITLVEDCLGYRRFDRHQMAVQQLNHFMSANFWKSARVLAQLLDPSLEFPSSDSGAIEVVVEEEDDDDDDDDDDDEDEEEEEQTEEQQHKGEEEKQEKEATEGSTVMGDRRSTLLQAQADVLEVDSDEHSDEEVSLPTVGLPRRLLDRISERSFATRLSSKYSPRAARRPRITTTQYATPESPRSDPRHNDPGHESEKGDIEFGKLKFATASGHSRLISTHSGSSKQVSRLPWLDIIPPNYKSSQDIGPPASSHQQGSPCATSQSTASPPSSGGQKPKAMSTYSQKSRPLFGEDKVAESAGSRILHGLLPEDAAETAFEDVQSEVKWQSMFHQTGPVPRLVSCQATICDDGSVPLYRHPSDQTPEVHAWTPTVDRIRKAAEQVAGHRLNHALIQLYRDGNDFISEHSDKTLDITPDSNIVNVSMGAQRTMRIRTKRGAGTGSGNTAEARTTYRVPLPHNSMVTMSLQTNAEYLHAIPWDRRPPCELVEAEKAFGGQRISLTFRCIATFLSQDRTMIWGQGAVGKSKDTARRVVHGDPEESQKLVDAFGKENAASSIEWKEIYGSGSDVLHLKQQQ